MKKLTILIAALAIMAAVPHGEAGAQKFLKKVGNAIEKGAKAVDKALDDVSGSSKQSSSGTSSGNKKVDYVVPYVTQNTKRIYVDDVSTLDLSIIPCLEEGIFWVNERKKKAYLYDTLGNRLDFDYGDRQMIATSNYSINTIPEFKDGVASFRCVLNNKGTDLLEKDGTVRAHLADITPLTQFNNIGIAAGYYSYMPQGGHSMAHIKYNVVYYNTKGEIVLENISGNVSGDPSRFIKIRNMYNNRMAFMDYGTHKWGFVDENLEVVVPAKYTEVLDYSDGAAVVKDGSGNWGFIDKEGKTIIDHIYSNQPGSFRYGYALVKKRTGNYPYAFIDKTGKIVMENINSVSWRMGEYSSILIPSDDGWDRLILDADLKVIHKGEAVNFVEFYSDNMWFTNDGAFDMYGNPLILGCKTPFVNGLALMSYSADSTEKPIQGFMRPNGEIAILFEIKEF